MTTKPSAFPLWAETATGNFAVSGLPRRVQPPVSWRNDGWDENEEPPPNYENWQGYTVSQWLQFFDTVCQRAATEVVAAVDAGEDSLNMADRVCDGSDDQVEIQAAVTAVAALGGGTVLLTEGTYVVSDSIVLDDGVSIIGRGPGATTIQVAAAVAGSFNIIGCGVSADYWRLAGFSIDGNSPSHSQEHTGIVVNASDFIIADVQISQCRYSSTAAYGHGIYVDAGVRGTIRQCRMASNVQSGITITSSADRVEVVNCISYGNTTYGIADGGEGTSIHGGQYSGNGAPNVRLSGTNTRIAAAYVTDAIATYGIDISSATGVQVTGCVIVDNGHHGVHCSSGTDILIQGNRLIGNGKTTDDTYANVYVTAGTSILITGNQMRRGSGNQSNSGVHVDNGSAPSSCYVYGNDLVLAGKSLSWVDAGGNALTMPHYAWDGAAHTLDDLDDHNIT